MQKKLRYLIILASIVFTVIPSAVNALQEYWFLYDEPKLIIYPQTTVIEFKQPSSLSLLTDQLSTAGSFEVYEYIRIVFAEMISIYQQEAQRARESAISTDDKSKQRKLYRWSNNALNYAETLASVFNGINQYSTYQVYTDNNHASYVLVDNYPVVISSPVINQQKTLEQNIINAVCEQMYCDAKFFNQQMNDAKKNIRVRGGWKLQKDSYIFYTFSGLHFVFNTIENKKLKQKLSLKISADLNFLAESLAMVIEQGVFVDWAYIRLNPLSGSRYHELVLNSFGDKLRLTVNAIQHITDFPRVAAPWLQERIKRPSKEFYLHDADEFLNAVYLR